MSYRVQLDVYEGPMDLLLFLIRRSEIDINNIPIAQITRQYLDYIQLMRVLNLDIAGDFIVMASTLIRIKARMLLPKTELEEAEEDDPRSELIQNLLEYQEFKKVADGLDERQEIQRDIFHRHTTNIPELESGEIILNVSIFDLLSAFQQAIEAAPEEIFHEINRSEVSLDERTSFIITYLAEKRRASFFDMFPKGTEKIILVVTFIALLELIKKKKVRIGQSASFGEIWIYYNDNPPAAQDSNSAPEQTYGKE